MSFDVTFQGFRAGEPAAGHPNGMRAVLSRHDLTADGTSHLLRTRDGGADLYLTGDGMMANHIVGEDVWDILVEGARAANWVVLAPSVATCLTRPTQRPELPAELAEEALLVETGAQLKAAVVG